jgi:hypothetical protein
MKFRVDRHLKSMEVSKEASMEGLKLENLITARIILNKMQKGHLQDLEKAYFISNLPKMRNCQCAVKKKKERRETQKTGIAREHV